MAYISIDFKQTIKQAERLEASAQKLRNMVARDYQRSMQTLSNDWKSDSSRAFLSKGDKLRQSMENTARDLETIAGNIRRAAYRMHEAEKKAEAIAKQREA